MPDNDLIVEFLNDCMSGGNDFAFRHTQHHGGVRSQEEDGVTVVWINSPIGNPDEGGFSVEGETFAEAMVEYIREAGTPKCVAELEEALRPTVSREAVHAALNAYVESVVERAMSVALRTGYDVDKHARNAAALDALLAALPSAGTSHV